MPRARQFLTDKDIRDLRDAALFWTMGDSKAGTPPPPHHGYLNTHGEFSTGWPDTEDDEETQLIWETKDQDQVLYIMNEWLERIPHYANSELLDEWEEFQRGERTGIAVDDKAINYMRSFVKPLALRIRVKAIKAGASDNHLD